MNEEDGRVVDKRRQTIVWPSCGDDVKCWTNPSIGVSEGSVYSDGTSSKRIAVPIDSPCFNKASQCTNGLTLMFWLKHEIKVDTGQTFFAAGSPESDNTGFRIFQLQGISNDHVEVQVVSESSNCIWTFDAPQRIWSHFVLKLYSFELYLSGEKKEPLKTNCTSGFFPFGSTGVWFGDSSSGLPRASYDDVILVEKLLIPSEIRMMFQYYQGNFICS